MSLQHLRQLGGDGDRDSEGDGDQDLDRDLLHLDLDPDSLWRRSEMRMTTLS